jgi:hypothetical protein
MFKRYFVVALVVGLVQFVVAGPLVYSTYLGGSDTDWAQAIAADNEGNAYVVGMTQSNDFPTSPLAFNTTYKSLYFYNIFVTKLNATGTAISYSTFLGSGRGYAIAVDNFGNAYVTGYTSSSAFPVTAGAYDTSRNGSTDVFVTKLNSTGSALIYSTYIGSTTSEVAYGIAIDTVGNAYITGITYGPGYPVTPGAFDTSYHGEEDVFVTKLDPAGASLVYSTYFGGSSTDQACSIAVDSAGNAYICGYTFSTSQFPVTFSAFDTTLNGSLDGFVAKLNNTGSALVYSTFIGGSEMDEARGIAVDNSGNAYITGFTESSTFPITPGALDTTFNARTTYLPREAFVSKLNANGSSLLYSTFLGGRKSEIGVGIAIDTAGNAYVTGLTDSDDFPITAGAVDTTHDGDYDIYITKLNHTGSSILYSTYLGGFFEEGWPFDVSIALDNSNNIYVAGRTDSLDFPVTPGAYDTIFPGSFGYTNAFVAKFNLSLVTSVEQNWQLYK